MNYVNFSVCVCVCTWMALQGIWCCLFVHNRSCCSNTHTHTNWLVMIWIKIIITISWCITFRFFSCMAGTLYNMAWTRWMQEFCVKYAVMMMIVFKDAHLLHLCKFFYLIRFFLNWVTLNKLILYYKRLFQYI